MNTDLLPAAKGLATKEHKMTRKIDCVLAPLREIYFVALVSLPTGRQVCGKRSILFSLAEGEQVIIRIKEGEFFLPPGFCSQMPCRVYSYFFIKQ
jgi:hypothetical protein